MVKGASVLVKHQLGKPIDRHGDIMALSELDDPCADLRKQTFGGDFACLRFHLRIKRMDRASRGHRLSLHIMLPHDALLFNQVLTKGFLSPSSIR